MTRSAAKRARPMRPPRFLVMMVKVPVAGRVKTRLARGIGLSAATSFYRHAAANLAARLHDPRRWSLVLAVAPDPHSRALPHTTRRMRQGEGDLGQRLQYVFDKLPRGPVLVIGSDVPEICPAEIAHAFRVLGANDAVLGPSPDGGYWLIGLRRRPRRLQPFRNVPWSTDKARAATLANLAGNSVAIIGEMSDVDDVADWQTHSNSRGRRILSSD